MSDNISKLFLLMILSTNVSELSLISIPPPARNQPTRTSQRDHKEFLGCIHICTDQNII